MSIPAFWPENSANKAEYRTTQDNDDVDVGEIYSTEIDETQKSRVWLVRQPEAVILAKGSLIIIIITALFDSAACFAGPIAPALIHSHFLIQPAAIQVM